jgi:hypothetical protein
MINFMNLPAEPGGNPKEITLCAMPFAFLADLPADAPGAILAVALGVGAGAAFLAVPLVIFLADGKGFPFWMVDAIHGYESCL